MNVSHDIGREGAKLAVDQDDRDRFEQRFHALALKLVDMAPVQSSKFKRLADRLRGIRRKRPRWRP